MERGDYFCSESDQKILYGKTIGPSTRQCEFFGSGSLGFDIFQNHTLSFGIDL